MHAGVKHNFKLKLNLFTCSIKSSILHVSRSWGRKLTAASIASFFFSFGNAILVKVEVIVCGKKWVAEFSTKLRIEVKLKCFHLIISIVPVIIFGSKCISRQNENFMLSAIIIES